MANSGGAGYMPAAKRRATGNGGARPPQQRPISNGGAPAPRPGRRQPPNVGNNGGAAAPPSGSLPPVPGAGSVGGGGGGAPAPPGPPPLDSQYWNQWNQTQFGATQRINAIKQQGAFDLTQRDTLLQQLADRQPLLEQQTTNAGNARGLLYGGALGSQIGDLKTSYVQNVGQLNDSYARNDAARTSEIDSIQGGLPFQELAYRLASIDRATKAAANAPLVTPALPAAAVPRAVGHSTRYTGPGHYRTVGPDNRNLRARGHSPGYRGPGHYVRVKK